MTEVAFNRYNNILIFAQEWRKYKLQEKPLSVTSFRNNIQTDTFVLIKCIDTKERNILIYLLDENSKYTSVQELKKILNKISDFSIIILVSHNTYNKKIFNQFPKLNIYSYHYSTFDLVIPKGPLCCPHRILSREEVLKLCNHELQCTLNNLPKIFDDDKQCIWIGAESGDVIEIIMPSDISGETIQYRVTVPRSGKIIFIKEDEVFTEIVETTEPKEENNEEEDEETAEYKDSIAIHSEGSDESDEEKEHEHNEDHEINDDE